MADAEDAHDVPFECEQDAVVAQAETEGTGHIAVQRVTSPEPVRAKCSVPLEQAHGGGAVSGEHVGLGLVEHSMQ